MLLRDLPQALLRRWYLLVLGLALAAGATFMTWTQIGPSYVTRSSTLLLPPSSVTDPVPPATEAGNPLLYMGNLAQPRDALISTMRADGVVDDLQKAFPGTLFTLEPDYAASAPIIVATITSPTEEVAVNATRYTSEHIREQVTSIQESMAVAPSQQIRSMSLSTDVMITLSTQSTTRAAAVVAGSTVLMAILFVGLIDGLLARRALRRRVKETSAHDGGDQPEVRARRAVPRPPTTRTSGDAEALTVPESAKRG